LAQAVLGTKKTATTTLTKLISVSMEASLLHWTELILAKQPFKCTNTGPHDPPKYDPAQMRRFNELVGRVDADRKAHPDGAADSSMVALFQEHREGQANHAAAPVDEALYDLELDEEEE